MEEKQTNIEKIALAMSRFNRNLFDGCIKICDEILKVNPNDLSTQLLKTHAIRRKNYVDHLEVDEETLGEILLDQNQITNMARPGTSLRGTTGKGTGRPMSSSGRPLTGVVRPGTISNDNGNNSIRKNQNTRAGTSRATTAGGRYLRIATASLQSLNSSFSLNSNDINAKTIIKSKSKSKAVADYLFYVEKNFKLLLEIASNATVLYNYNDWYWKYQLGKVYYKFGQLGDAEKQLKSALKMNDTFPYTALQLCHVYMRQDQPVAALEILKQAAESNPGEVYYKVYQARIKEMLMNYEESISLYRESLLIDNCNFEAIACIGNNYFYNNSPEVALVFYKRLFELGINSAEIWNNLALCAFYSYQYDFCFSCFDKALSLSKDDTIGDIWYNISHVAISVGDLNLAHQALKLTIDYSPEHYEAYNNLGVIELILNKDDKQAKSNFLASCNYSDYAYEPYYNYAALRYKSNDMQEAYKFSAKAVEKRPDHFESKELKEKIEKTMNL